MAALPVQKCVSHPNNNVQYVYFAEKVIKVCRLCANAHPKHVLSISNFGNVILENLGKLQKTEKEAFRRHEQLSQIIAKFKSDYAKVQNETIRQVLKVIEQQNKRFNEEYSILQRLKKKLQDLFKLLHYFETIKDKDLMDIKLNLSSEKGLKQYFRKYNVYTSVIKKKNYDEFMKIQREIKEQTEKVQQLQKKSIVRLINEYLYNQKKVEDTQKKGL